MDRRAFLRNTAQIGMLLQVAPLAAFSEGTSLAKDYRKWMVIDALCAVNTDDTTVKPEILTQAMQSGVTAINWTISAPSFDDTVENISFVERIVENDPEHWIIVRRQADLESAKREKKIGISHGIPASRPHGAGFEAAGNFSQSRRSGNAGDLQQSQPVRRRLPGAGQRRPE